MGSPPAQRLESDRVVLLRAADVHPRQAKLQHDQRISVAVPTPGYPSALLARKHQKPASRLLFDLEETCPAAAIVTISAGH